MIRVKTREELARALLVLTVSQMEVNHSEETQRAVTTLGLSTLQSSVVESMVSECNELIGVVEEVFGNE